MAEPTVVEDGVFVDPVVAGVDAGEPPPEVQSATAPFLPAAKTPRIV
jgi:hypothetical protein